MPDLRQSVTGIILAGGRGRRMQEQDKGLLEFAGQPLIEHVIAAIRPQVSTLIISANRNLETYRGYGYDVVEDDPGGYLGPLAGIASAGQRVATELVLVVPCDMPQLPPDLVDRLWAAMQHDAAALAVAHDGRRMHPVVALLRSSLANDLPAALASGLRRAQDWVEQQHHALADFSDEPRCFNNLNTADDLQRGSG